MKTIGDAVDVGRLILILIMSLSITFLAYFVLVNSWTTATTVAAIHSMIAFLAISCSGFILVQYRIREESEDTVFHAALIYASLINIGKAIRIFIDNDFVNLYGEVQLLVTDLAYLFTFSILIFIGVLLKKFNLIKNRPMSAVSLILIGVSTHLGIIFGFIPIISTPILIILGLCLGLSVLVLLPVSGIVWAKSRSSVGNFDFTYMIAGFTVFGISWIPLTISLFIASNIWTLAFPLMMVGLILLCVGSAIPFLRRIGVHPVYAYLVIIGLALLGVFPPGVSIIVDSYMSILPIVNRFLFVFLHLGASLMAAIMATLMYIYDNQQHHPKRRPIISLFITWATIELYQVGKAILLPEYLIADSLIPYLVASFFLLVHIPYAIRWTGEHSKPRQANPGRVIITAPIIALVVFAADVFHYMIHGTVIGLGFEALGQSILLGSTLMGMFAFVYHSSVQIKDGKGRITVDVLTTAFLALWIIPAINKANFDPWTIGWWTSEIILLLGVLFGPAVLGYLYLKELSRAAESQKRATLFSDLLVHDISNYHQALALTIGILDMDDAKSDVKEQAINDAYLELQRADQLIRNVRRLGMAEKLVPERFSPIDVIPILNESFHLAARKSTENEIKFSIETECESCYVKANPLLKDVFINIFDNSIKYSEQAPVIKVMVEEVVNNRVNWCSIKIIDNGIGISPDKREKLFERYMEDAVGTGLGLSVVRTLIHAFGGTIRIEERVPGNYQEGTVFHIMLRME